MPQLVTHFSETEMKMLLDVNVLTVLIYVCTLFYVLINNEALNDLCSLTVTLHDADLCLQGETTEIQPP